MKDFIYVFTREKAVHVLGPGTRYVLWVQGCAQNCSGCITPQSRDMTKGTPIKINALALEIAMSEAEGLTISGGEPFLQAEELAEMIKIIRKIRSVGVIVYSGYLYEELLKRVDAQKLLSEIDLLIDGPYIQELDDGKSLRGSSNQKVITLTDLYKKDLEKYGKNGREREMFHHGVYINRVGIPKIKHLNGE